MNSKIYNLARNEKFTKKETEYLIGYHGVLYNCLTEEQRKRIHDNYEQYKKDCISFNKQYIDFHIYCLRHIELSVIR